MEHSLSAFSSREHRLMYRLFERIRQRHARNTVQPSEAAQEGAADGDKAEQVQKLANENNERLQKIREKIADRKKPTQDKFNKDYYNIVKKHGFEFREEDGQKKIYYVGDKKSGTALSWDEAYAQKKEISEQLLQDINSFMNARGMAIENPIDSKPKSKIASPAKMPTISNMPKDAPAATVASPAKMPEISDTSVSVAQNMAEAAEVGVIAAVEGQNAFVDRAAKTANDTADKLAAASALKPSEAPSSGDTPVNIASTGASMSSGSQNASRGSAGEVGPVGEQIKPAEQPPVRTNTSKPDNAVVEQKPPIDIRPDESSLHFIARKVVEGGMSSASAIASEGKAAVQETISMHAAAPRVAMNVAETYVQSHIDTANNVKKGVDAYINWNAQAPGAAFDAVSAVVDKRPTEGKAEYAVRKAEESINMIKTPLRWLGKKIGF